MLLEEVLAFNQKFVDKKSYQQYETDGLPNKKAVILTCMDTRLVELLPKALNFNNGDVKIIKTAGAFLTHPYGSVMRSILIAIHALKAKEVFVVAHHDCGMLNLDTGTLMEIMRSQGITDEVIEQLPVNPTEWLKGFTNVEDSVKASISIIENHLLLPQNTPVHGLVIDPHTGKLDLVSKGY